MYSSLDTNDTLLIAYIAEQRDIANCEIHRESTVGTLNYHPAHNSINTLLSMGGNIATVLPFTGRESLPLGVELGSSHTPDMVVDELRHVSMSKCAGVPHLASENPVSQTSCATAAAAAVHISTHYTITCASNNDAESTEKLLNNDVVASCAQTNEFEH